jgi:hypothetical protein
MPSRLVKPLRADTLHVDPNVQRSINMNRAKNMGDELNEDALGVLTVSHRADGKYYIVDGQHRHGAVISAGRTDMMLLCHIYQGMSLEEEAALFRVLNTAQKPSPIDLFRVRLVEGDPAARDIAKIIAKHNFTVAHYDASHRFSAVVAANQLYMMNADRFEDAVDVLLESWPQAPEALRGEMLKGMFSVLERYYGIISTSALVNKLKRYPGGAPRFHMDAKGAYASAREMHLSDHVATKIVNVYNKGNRSNLLQKWDGRAVS